MFYYLTVQNNLCKKLTILTFYPKKILGKYLYMVMCMSSRNALYIIRVGLRNA